MRISRRRWTAWGTAGFLFGAAGASGRVLGQSVVGAPAWVSPGSPKIAIAVVEKSSFCFLPLTVAERLGYFASEGVSVTVRDYPDIPAAMQSVVSGAAQVLGVSYATAALLQARGVLPMTAFVLQGRTPQVVLGLDSQVTAGIGDLIRQRSLRVGVAGLHTGSHRVARVVFQRAQVPADKVVYVPLREHARAIAAFRAGQLDVISHTDPAITTLEQEGSLKVLVDTRTVRGNADVFGGPLPAACLAAAEPFLDQRPEVAQALANALVRALKWLQTAGPSDIIRVVPETYFQGDRSIYLAAFSRAREAWTPDGVMPANGPEVLVKTLARLGEWPELQEADLGKTYTNRFALKAKARYRA
jgi:NitT/TauT family transport system substrate-binding protein